MKTMMQHFIVAGFSFTVISLLDFFVFTSLELSWSIVIRIILYITVLSVYIFLFRNHEGGRQIILMIQKVFKLKK